MRLVLAALVAGTGCAQVFGIDQTSGPDANTSGASVQVQKVSIGASVVKTPLDMTDQMATFYDDSAGTLAPVPGVQSAMDTFSAAVPGTPSVIYTLPDVQVPTRMLALPAAAQRVNYAEYEHPGAQEEFATSAIDLDINLPSPYVTGETFSIQAIGAWMQRALGAADLPAVDTAVSTIAPADIPYSSFGLMITGNPRVRITAADVVLVTRYAGAKLTGVFQAQFEQTDGLDAVAGTMTAVQANTPVMAAIDPPAYATRFAAVRPAVAGLPMSWRVTAAPGWSVGNDQGVRLANGSATAGDGVTPPDTMVATTYGNPFESLDWKAVFVFSASASRAYSFTQDENTVSVSLTASMAAFSEPSESLDLDMPAGLPLTITANELALVTDGQMLPLDLSQPVVFEATVDRPTNTAYTLSLVELGIDATGASPVLVRKILLDAVTAGEPRFKLPPELFTAGKTYYVTLRSYQGGFVDAATGDLQTFSLPYSYSGLDSAVFTVGMP